MSQYVKATTETGVLQFLTSVAACATLASLVSGKVNQVAADLFDRENFFHALIVGVFIGGISHQACGDRAFGKGDEGKKSVRNMGYLLGLINLAALGSSWSPARAAEVCPLTSGLYLGLLATHLVIKKT